MQARRRLGQLKRAPVLVLADNVRRLMAHEAISQAELARRSGVSQPAISTLLRSDRPLEINPRLSTVCRLAVYFGMQPWQLMLPGLPLDLLRSGAVARLAANYRDALPEGRRAIERIVECELRYGAVREGAPRP